MESPENWWLGEHPIQFEMVCDMLNLLLFFLSNLTLLNFVPEKKKHRAVSAFANSVKQKEPNKKCEYPPGNQHILPREKENHLQKCLGWGYASSREGN